MKTRTDGRKKLAITIDGTVYTTRDDDQDAASLMRLAGVDPEKFDLAKVKKDGDLKVYNDGKVIDLSDGDKFVTVTFGVKLNDVFVPLDGRQQTGAAIKAAAIAAGVPEIALAWSLSEVRPNGEQKVVPDDKQIKVDYNDEFWAVPGDDNS
jgi:hypothetical protein